ncbi:HTH-type transcriptional activator RhaR [Paenibacillus solanacearum]|uniref:HTH-type transcriptional activator RhaR n=1 Tax=Paenibacillus solanacearum TaxID=2048548 RepID=A0A916NQ87_9BACL|nr:AraC family transcriptional regulator [Paenibacillus solanacearum]CAG7621965.1 HTH-type transcriptional activator RhaR [Paenibacillus solanacearum]
MKKFILPLLQGEVLLPFYVYCVGGTADQPPIRRLGGYPYYIWLHTVKGKGKLYLEQSVHTLREHTGVLIYPGSAHEYYSLESPWETHWVAFQGYGVAPLLKQIGLERSSVYHLSNMQLLDRRLNDIYMSSKVSGPDSGMTSSGKLYSFLIDLKNGLHPDRARSQATAHSRLQPVFAYMESHYRDDLSLDRLAVLIGASPQYLCRIFKQTVQMSPVIYLTRLRLQKAKELLVDNHERTVGETAASVGFHDTSYFCSVFKQYEGMTPLEFRKSYMQGYAHDHSQ